YYCSSPPRPRSTLFPYTTLFRSLCFHRVAQVQLADTEVEPGGCVRWLKDRRLLKLCGSLSGFFSLQIVSPQIVMRLSRTGIEQRDRKSTRLNSSHVSISYAVFCL